MFSRIEQELLDHGHVRSVVKIQAAAKVFEFFYRSKTQQKKWIEDQMKLEYKTMNIIQTEAGDVQRMNALEKHQKLSEDLTEPEKVILDFYRKQIPSYEKMWWHHNQSYHEHMFAKPKGCLLYSRV
jgi:hypothetical protein